MRTAARPELNLSLLEVRALSEFIRYYADMSNDCFSAPERIRQLIESATSKVTVDKLIRRGLVKLNFILLLEYEKGKEFIGPLSGMYVLQATDRELVLECADIRFLDRKPLSKDQVRSMRVVKKRPVQFAKGIKVTTHR